MSQIPSAARGTASTEIRPAIGQALFGLVTGAVQRVPRDLSLTSLSTLSTLEQTGPRRVTDLAAVEGVTQPSMTVLVSGLQRSGLVERRADPTDKRVTLVALTASGSDYLRARRRIGADAFVQLIDKLPAHEAEALAGAITALEHLRDLDGEQRDRATRSSAGGPEGESP
jgi:DNA-binding MarR family transcriptional regulator